MQVIFNTLRPRQNGRHFADDPFKRIKSWMKLLYFRLKNHWSLFLRVQLTTFQHWFRYWLGADQVVGYIIDAYKHHSTSTSQLPQCVTFCKIHLVTRLIQITCGMLKQTGCLFLAPNLTFMAQYLTTSSAQPSVQITSTTINTSKTDIHMIVHYCQVFNFHNFNFGYRQMIASNISPNMTLIRVTFITHLTYIYRQWIG